MPELPEVETTRRGIQDSVCGVPILQVIVRNPHLRWPVPHDLASVLTGNQVERVERRGKYLLLYTHDGCLLVHLGMSGSLRIATAQDTLLKHDHIDVVLHSGKILRYSDPRRFGCVLWLSDTPLQHPLLRHLGPEPLTDAFDGSYLFLRSRKRRTPIKQFLMDSEVVVGVGNIYANEALFMAGIRPDRAAGSLSRARYTRLVACVKVILGNAISLGGTTLRDFVGGDGKPGYFKQSLLVYGRGGEDCRQCNSALVEIRQGQRSSVYCKHCQR